MTTTFSESLTLEIQQELQRSAPSDLLKKNARENSCQRSPNSDTSVNQPHLVAQPGNRLDDLINKVGRHDERLGQVSNRLVYLINRLNKSVCDESWT